MSERDELLVSIADTFRTYRQGALPEMSADCVGTWASQFTEATQTEFLREFDYVTKRLFLSRERMWQSLEEAVVNPELVGSDPAAYWARSNIMQNQADGGSQWDLVMMLSECLKERFGLDLKKCGREGGDYIYMDDVLFTGRHAALDLEYWMKHFAPATAVLHVIVMVAHTRGRERMVGHVKRAIAESGKNIELRVWNFLMVEDCPNRRDDSGVLWPASIPEDEAVQAYADQCQVDLRKNGGALGEFRSEAGRQLLEREFLIAGVKILSKVRNPSPHTRPLGWSKSGLGFGSMLVTYRNCPNTCPLAMWWGDGGWSGALTWYPLLPRWRMQDEIDEMLR